MAATAPSPSTRRWLARVQHFVFPSRRRALLALLIDAACLVVGLPLPVHLLVAVVVHLVMAQVP